MRIAFLGDVALIGKYDASQVGEPAVRERLCAMREILSGFDYVVANLESPLTDQTKTREKKSMPLRSPTVNVGTLEYLGVRAVSLANNHAYDYGEKGIADTLKALDEHGIARFGLGNAPLRLDLSGERVALQGFCCFTANGWHYDALSKKGKLHSLTLPALESFLSEAEANGDYPIIVPHWGEENTHYPKSEHVLMAQAILKRARCSIVGHHPHVPQGIISSENGLCAFSLGNFVFDDCFSEKNGMRVIQTEDNKRGFILALDIENGRLAGHSVIAYGDDGERIVPDEEGQAEIEKYGKTIEQTCGQAEYERKRTEEQQSARTQRLGKRDLSWLLHHLNYASVVTVLQRRKNQRAFASVVESFSDLAGDLDTGGKALYVGNFGTPHTNAAGKRVFSNACLIRACGKRDVLLIGTDPGMTGRVIPVTDGIGYTSFPQYGKGTGKKYFLWLKRRIERSASLPVAIFRYGSPGLATFDRRLSAYCKKRGIPLVVDVVDWLKADGGSIIFRTIKNFDTFLEKRIYNKKGDGLIAISSYLEKYYRKSFRNRIILPPLVGAYAEKETVNPTPQIVYAGSPFRGGERVKDPRTLKDRLDLVVSAFASLEDRGVPFHLHVIGLTKEEYLVAFPDHRDLLDRSPSILFYGRLPMKKTQEMISGMDYSVLFRDRTRATMAGFPTKVVESMSLGVPVITSDTSDLRRYITDGENGFFVDLDDGKLTDRLSEILASPPERVAEIKRRIADEKAFLTDRFTDEFKRFLEKLVP